MFVDMHSHLSGWSPDASQSVEELLAAARERRLDGIAITDHYDIGSVTAGGQTWVFDPKQHEAQLAPLRMEPSMRTKDARPGLLAGIEIGYVPRHLAQIRRLIAENAFDCVLLSLHEYRGIDPYNDPQALYTSEDFAFYSNIVEAIADSAEAVPEANVIGHYDYVSRYAPAGRPKMLYRHAPAAFDRLFRTMIRNRQALEINTQTVKILKTRHGYSLEEAMPDPAILARYRELGGTLLTLGSDAHRQADIAQLFPETADWLLRQGFSEYAWLERRQWRTAPLSEGRQKTAVF